MNPKPSSKLPSGVGLGDEHADRSFRLRLSRAPVEGQGEPARAAVQAGQLFASNALWRQMLAPDQALAHPWVNASGEVIDLILLDKQAVRHHVHYQALGQSDA